MFNKSKTKKVIISTLVVLMLVSTVAFAADVFEKKVTTTQGRIKLSYEGKDVTKEIEKKYGTPSFTVKDYDSRAYVPVRALAELMGIEVEYDHKTDVANFKDTEKKLLKEQLASKESETAKLKAELAVIELENKDLKKKLDEKKEESAKTSITELEKRLNKNYGVVDNVSFNIVLKESKDTITTNIYIDTRDNYERNAWNRMDQRRKERIIEDLVKEIEKDFKKYKVEGSIYDNFDKYTLYEFSMNTNGRLVITNRDNTRDNLMGDAEYYLDLNLNKLGKVSKVDVRERGLGEIFGQVTLKDEGKLIRDIDLDDVLFRTEDTLISKFGNNIRLDIEVYYGNKLLGRYYNEQWRYR